jgi:Flp pilus assembly protein TadB
VEVVLATALLIGGLVYATLAFRAAKSMRRGTDEEWKRQWRELDPQRRKQIRRSLRRGEAVREPQDADLALRAVAQVKRVRRSLRPLNLASPLMFLLLVVTLVSLGEATAAVVFGVVLGVLALLWVVPAWTWKRYRQSAAATRRLTER